MGDHFVLLVDRLLTQSTLEAAIGDRTQSNQLTPSLNDDKMIDCSSHMDFEHNMSPSLCESTINMCILILGPPV